MKLENVIYCGDNLDKKSYIDNNREFLDYCLKQSKSYKKVIT
jgi:hypothetical protein